MLLLGKSLIWSQNKKCNFKEWKTQIVKNRSWITIKEPYSPVGNSTEGKLEGLWWLPCGPKEPRAWPASIPTPPPNLDFSLGNYSLPLGVCFRKKKDSWHSCSQHQEVEPSVGGIVQDGRVQDGEQHNACQKVIVTYVDFQTSHT